MNLLFVLLNVRIKDNRFVMWNKNDILSCMLPETIHGYVAIWVVESAARVR